MLRACTVTGALARYDSVMARKRIDVWSSSGKASHGVSLHVVPRILPRFVLDRLT